MNIQALFRMLDAKELTYEASALISWEERIDRALLGRPCPWRAG